MSCKFGLRALRDRRLKISEIRSLNDPFDLLPFDLSDAETRRSVAAARSEIGKNCGLLCFSRHWHNPVLWSHYAESHSGFCLGFEVPDDLTQPITYVDRAIRLEHLDIETAMAMNYTKYADWRYEEEIRMGVVLRKKSGPQYFYDFGDELRLVEIIVGAGCPVSRRRILLTLGAHHDGISILKARLAFDAFMVVEDENGFGVEAARP
jgi:hypothetical protein